MIKKQLIKTFLSLGLIMGFGSEMSEASNIIIQVNGKAMNMEQPYINKDSRTMVPIRFVSQSLGVKDSDVLWDGSEQVATIKKNNQVIQFTVGQSTISINNQVKSIDTKAELKDGRVFVPLRAISEAFDAQVKWDGTKRVVSISTKEQANGFQLPKMRTALETGNTSHGLSLDQLKAYWDKTDEKGWRRDYKTYDEFATVIKKGFVLYDQTKITIDTKNRVIRATLPNYNPKEIYVYVGIPDGLDKSYYNHNGIPIVKPNMSYVIPFSKLNRDTGVLTTLNVVDTKSAFVIKSTTFLMDKQTGQIRSIPFGQFIDNFEYLETIPWEVQP